MTQPGSPGKRDRKKSVRSKLLRGRPGRLWGLTLKACVAVCGLVALSIFFVVAYHWVVDSRYLRLTEVTVAGVDETLKGELILGAGLTGNVSLMALNIEELKADFEANPWVRRARVERRFPNSLHVTVEKQVSVAVVVMDRLFYMNPGGELFKMVNIDEPVDFPMITGITALSVKTREQLRQAAHVIASVKREAPPWSLEGLSEIHMGRDGHVSLFYKHLNAEIRTTWNDVEGSMPGLRKVVNHLMQSGRLSRVAAIDLNQADGAVVSMKSG